MFRGTGNVRQPKCNGYIGEITLNFSLIVNNATLETWELPVIVENTFKFYFLRVQLTIPPVSPESTDKSRTITINGRKRLLNFL